MSIINEPAEIVVVRKPWHYIWLKNNLFKKDGNENMRYRARIQEYENLFAIIDRKPYRGLSHCCEGIATKYAIGGDKSFLIYRFCDECSLNSIPSARISGMLKSKYIHAMSFMQQRIITYSDYFKKSKNPCALSNKEKSAYKDISDRYLFHKGLDHNASDEEIFDYFSR